MLNLLSQSKAQIMLITSHELQLLVWKNNTLSVKSTYANSAQGLNQLDSALIKSRKFPVIIVTNFIEESFLNETIAHVGGNDRKALLERKLGYAFRTTPYRVAKVTEREQEGRRDDKILLSALSKPELLRPWIKLLLDKKVAIQSITSAAYLAELYAQNTKVSKEDHVLLVTLEHDSELRQTYLKKGQILFSRLTSLPVNDTTNLAENIYKESLQIRSYLERIKMLPYDEVLSVQTYTNFSHTELNIHAKTTRLNAFENINLDEQLKHYSLDLNNSKPNAISLFLAHVLQKTKIKNIYAPFNTQRYFHLTTVSRSLIWSASALILALVLLKTPTLLTTLDNWTQQEQVLSQTAPLLTEYDLLSQRFPETPIPSEEMALVVETYEVINQQSYRLEQTLGIISQALTASPTLKLTGINWQVSEQVAAVIDDGFGFGPPPSANPGQAFQQATLDNRTTLKVRVDGLSFSPSSYRSAQDQVLLFADALAAYPRLSVDLLKMPTDVRVDSTIQTTVDGDEVRAQFTLEVTVEAER